MATPHTGTDIGLRERYAASSCAASSSASFTNSRRFSASSSAEPGLGVGVPKSGLYRLARELTQLGARGFASCPSALHANSKSQKTHSGLPPLMLLSSVCLLDRR